MLQVEYRLKLGQDEFVIKAEVKDEKDFFETMSFYSNLPKVAPAGATDLKLVFRTTTQGHKYYSIVSEKEKMEFKFGQNLENKGGGLFQKGWEPLYQGNQNQESAPQQQPQYAPPAQQYTPPASQPPVQQHAPPQTAQPPPQQQPAAPALNPQAVATANDVLARFGIGAPR